MANLNATELASRLGLSKPRISQYVSEGKLEGCYEGTGRARRFDLAKVADALGRRLDLGQMTGNGRETRRTLRAVSEDETADEKSEAPASRNPTRGYDGPVGDRDPDRLELATLQIKEEQARKARRDNARDEGLWLLAEEVQRQSGQALAKEVALFESLVREMARAVADQMGVDYRETRRVMMDRWRAHRTARAEQLEDLAMTAGMTEAEKAEQV